LAWWLRFERLSPFSPGPTTTVFVFYFLNP
jgi:hypothetical protein